MTEDGDRRISRAAQDEDERLRAAISDLTEFNVRKKRGPRRITILWLVLFLLAIGVLLLLINRPAPTTSPSDPLAAPAPEPSVTEMGGASREPNSGSAGPIDITAGPISGTWAMYWTNSEETESQGFTIRFTGADTGTLEVLNDDTEVDTTFTVEGDQVLFEFTRTFKVPIGDWPEKSVFTGVLEGRNEMSGEWSREGWECWGEPDAGCAYEAEWSRFPSRLIRMSQ